MCSRYSHSAVPASEVAVLGFQCLPVLDRIGEHIGLWLGRTVLGNLYDHQADRLFTWKFLLKLVIASRIILSHISKCGRSSF